MKLKEALTYDDVLLSPQYSTICSRQEIDIGNTLKHDQDWFDLPIIASPMDTVTEGDMAYAMAQAGGLGVIHRYNDIEKQARIVRDLYDVVPPTQIAAAIGVTGSFLDRAIALWENGFRHVTNNMRPIGRPDDLAGVSDRAQGKGGDHGIKSFAIEGQCFTATGVDIDRYPLRLRHCPGTIEQFC